MARLEYHGWGALSRATHVNLPAIHPNHPARRRVVTQAEVRQQCLKSQCSGNGNYDRSAYPQKDALIPYPH